ncbi:MAG TPA: DUF6777 domain-containing protein [Acidimicrobiales bacterium]
MLAGILFVSAVVIFFAGRSGKANAGEIILQGKDTPGTNTFTPSIATPPPANQVATATASPTPSQNGLTTAKGDAPGLYAGQRDVPSCKADQLISYLQTNPSKASAWASAIEIDPSQIKDFVATLTPALLRVDTRVTDFEFGSNAKPLPKQTILQSGTAVMLDRTAFPRVRCQSGDPLAQPRAVTSTPSYTGGRWSGFSPTTVVVVTPAPQPVAIILIDVTNGAVFVRIPGSLVLIDINLPATGVAIIIVEPGGPFTVTGVRFPPGAALTVVFDNPAVTLATPTADGAGNFAVQVTAPATALPGVHQVTTTGGGVTLAQPVYVIPPAVRR